MPRPKRQPHPMLGIAHTHLSRLDPELGNARLHLRQLDGPAGAPRFSVSVALCPGVEACAHHTPDAERCPVFACAQRRALRLLLSREGELLQVIDDHLRWG